MNTTSITILGSVLIILVPIWLFLVIPEIEKLPTNFYHYEEQIGLNSLVPEYGTLLPLAFTHHNIHEVKVVSYEQNILEISSRLQATNIDTGEKFLDETRTFYVDRQTRSHLSKEEGFFLFPPNTQQHDYFLSFPLAFTAATFTFEGEDIIQNLPVYRFTCKSKPYDITKAIPHFEGFTVLSFYKCAIWVEPVTGRHVDFLLEWESFYEENGVLTYLAEKGYKRTDPEFVAQLVEKARTEKTIFQIYNFGFPVVFGIVGSLTLFINRFVNIKRSKELEKINIELKEKLRKEKLETIGELSARIAHDIKNPLQSIKNSFDLITILAPPTDLRLKKEYERIDRSITRISNQVNLVLDFVRDTPLKPEQISLQRALTYVINSISIPTNIIIELPENDFEIECDLNKIEVLFTNLITNAIQAIGVNEGQIKIRMSEGKDDTIIIEIEDSGLGIPKDVLSKIFEPLFTTKQAGTGLGLTSVKNIVELHKGTISVRQKPTTFVITLPRHQTVNKLNRN